MKFIKKFNTTQEAINNVLDTPVVIAIKDVNKLFYADTTSFGSKVEIKQIENELSVVSHIDEKEVIVTGIVYGTDGESITLLSN